MLEKEKNNLEGEKRDTDKRRKCGDKNEKMKIKKNINKKEIK